MNADSAFLKHLRCLAVTADTGTISAAARALHIAQPALSRRLQQLEQQVGARLMKRTRHGVALTPVGEALLAAARGLLERMDAAVRKSRETHDGLRGDVRLGLSRVALDHPALGGAIDAARRRYPDIRLLVSELSSVEQGRMLHSGELDLAVGAAAEESSPDLAQEPLYDESIEGVLVSPTHAIAQSGHVTLPQLVHHTLLTLTKCVPAHDAMLEALRAHGSPRTEEYETGVGLLHGAAMGRGWVLGPASMRTHPPVGTVYVPIHDFALRMPIYLRRRRRETSRTVINMAEAILARMHGHAHEKPAPSRAHARRSESRSAAPVLELPPLRALVTTIEAGSLTRAATQLHLTQSAISRRLHALQSAVGLPLLHRTPHGVVATPAGEVLRAEAADLFRLASQAMAAARCADAPIERKCVIGTLPLELTGNLLLDAIRDLADPAGPTQVEIVELKSEQQVAALRERRIDVGLIGALAGMLDEPDIASVVLAEDPFDCALVPASHELATRAWLTAADVAGFPFVIIAPEFGRRFHASVLRALGNAGVVPTEILHCDGPRAMWRGALQAKGWTVARRSQRTRPPAGMIAVSIEGFHLPCSTALVWRRDETRPEVRRLLDAIRRTPVRDWPAAPPSAPPAPPRPAIAR